MKKFRDYYGRMFGFLSKETIRVMKLTLFLSLFTIIQLWATESYSQLTKLTLKLENVKIADALKEIENQSEFFFLYSPKLIDVERKVNIDAENETIKDILSNLFEGKVIFAVYDRQVILSPNDLVFPSVPIQQLKITGTVTEKDGTPLPGVNITVKGTIIGTLSDADGKFSITVPDQNAILAFSFLGYITQEQLVSGKTVIDIALSPSLTSLDEVIVIGYGVQKKSDLTGSVARVTMDQKPSLMTNSNISQALSGATAGVNVSYDGGNLAGSEPNLSIRGRNTLSAATNPLIVLDGIIYNGAISDININDVQTIDVLKDASSAAVYGSRSSNGVLLITTKKGQTDKPRITFNMFTGFQTMTNNPMKVMNADQYALRLLDYSWEQNLNTWYKTMPTSDAGKPVRPDFTNPNIVASYLRTQEERDNYLAGNSIDWVKEVLQPAPIQNYSLDISGKGNRYTYFVSGSYNNEKGILKNDHFSRYTLHSNIESKITDWLTIGIETSYSHRNYSGLEASLANARTASPLANNHISSPQFDMNLTGELYMPYPLMNLYVNNSDISNNLFIVGSSKITVPWIKGLTYDFNYSNTYTNRNTNTFYPITTTGGAANKGQAIKNPSQERDWIINNIVTYLRTFGDHQLNVTLLFSREHSAADASTLTAQGFDNATLGYNNMGLGTIASVASSAWEQDGLSYMARASYSFQSRYLLTGTIREDGYSGFGANHKYATFPSISLGWVASEEPFLRDVKWLYLKLRTSYGINGNQGLGRYKSLSSMASSPTVFGSSTYVGLYPSTLGNADLGWEKTASFNIGLDYGFLNRRISGSIDVYKSTTSDVLVNRALPTTTGYSSVWANIGGIDNKGIELNLTTVNIDGKNGNIRWETGFVFSMNRDKISKLYSGVQQDIGNSWFVGKPISALYDYKILGVWEENELFSGNIYKNWYPGMLKYADLNGDGVLDANNDRSIIGYGTPNYRFSISNSLSYKNLTFSFFINSIQGGNNHYLANNAKVLNVSFLTDEVYRMNASAVRPYWTPDNGVTNASAVYNPQPITTSGIYQSRSFIRLQDISLTYKFGPHLLKSLKVDDCQVYISSKNPYTWTKWSGWDPETGVTDLPLMRNFTAGIRLTF